MPYTNDARPQPLVEGETYGSLETIPTNQLIAELGTRFNGFVFAAWEPSRVRGEYPDQVYYDTNLVEKPREAITLLRDAITQVEADYPQEYEDPPKFKPR